jgi:hypothetical protein
MQNTHETSAFENLTSSNFDGSTCSWTDFSRRAQICKQKWLIQFVGPAIPQIVMGAPGAGRVTFSDLDDPTCT